MSKDFEATHDCQICKTCRDNFLAFIRTYERELIREVGYTAAPTQLNKAYDKACTQLGVKPRVFITSA